jgi:hypothetical protein
MKAFQLLDHVLLWIARILSALFFFQIVRLEIALGSETRLIAASLLLCTVFALLAASTWCLNVTIARVYLGLISAFFFVVCIAAICREVTRSAFSEHAYMILPTLSFALMLWVALRSPLRIQRHKTENTPQSC